MPLASPTAPAPRRPIRSVWTIALAAAAIVLAAAPLPPVPLAAQERPDTAAYTPQECAACAGWNLPQAPFRIHGSTFYVGTRGLGALLVTSPEGHVLVDAGRPESAPRIMAGIRALGFRPEDVRVIVNSHAHHDHAGGIAAIQRVSGARVLVSAAAAPVVRTGRTGPNDPQHAHLLPFPAARSVETLRFGDTVRVGPLRLVPHETAGHAPGGTTWSWRACEGSTCHEIVYADSQTPVSSDDFLFTRSTSYPTALADFERGHATLERLRCDVLVTPHPSASGLFERMPIGAQGRLVADPEGCRRYAATARRLLAERLAREKAGR